MRAQATDSSGPSLNRDGVILLLFFEFLTLLLTGMTGLYHAFGVVLVMTLGTLTMLGFARRGEPVTWVIPAVATLVLLFGMIGVFAFENAVVTGIESTVLGFHPAAAVLVYVVWLPAFFTLGLTYTLTFDRLSRAARTRRTTRRRGETEGVTT